MMYEQNNMPYGQVDSVQRQQSLSRHVAKTYGWMFLGLLLTFSTAFAIATTNFAYLLFSVAWWLPIALMVGQLALVIAFTSRLDRMSVPAAQIIFLVYSVLTGVTFSTLLLAYDLSSVILAFGVACLFFGAMAVAGIVTKRDVSRFGPILMIGLICLLVMTLVSFFLRIPALDTAICFIGLLLFMGITTYDAKKTKDYYYQFEYDPQMVQKASIYSAFNLYLDFLNIFLYILRLLGRNSNN